MLAFVRKTVARAELHAMTIAVSIQLTTMQQAFRMKQAMEKNDFPMAIVKAEDVITDIVYNKLT